MFSGIDLFSDTVTKPTKGMRNAISSADVGDEQKGEDPTTLKLEKMAADLLGHTSAMFFPCATMANEIALKLWCEPGDVLIAAQNSHLFFAETGGPAIHAQVLAKPIDTEDCIFTGEAIEKLCQWPTGPHFPKSALVSVENTTNNGGGVPWSIDQLDSVFDTAKKLNLKIHLDGSRLFNASVATGLPVEKLAGQFDSATICLSKGLGCPTGAVLTFPKEEWSRVRRMKQLMGGAMRQSGILSAAGIYALENHIDRLKEDHENAAFFAESMKQFSKNIYVEKCPHRTNMVFFKWCSDKMSDVDFLSACEKKGLRFSHVGPNRLRAVFHLDISKDDTKKALEIVRSIIAV